jgi:hypothetical protein
LYIRIGSHYTTRGNNLFQDVRLNEQVYVRDEFRQRIKLA